MCDAVHVRERERTLSCGECGDGGECGGGGGGGER